MRGTLTRCGLVVVLALAVTSCSSGAEAPVPSVTGATTAGEPSGSTTPRSDPSVTHSATTVTPSAAETTSQPADDDARAGVTSQDFPQQASGRLVTVPGKTVATGQGKVVKVRVEVEKGLPLERAAFASFVMETLNDPRSWGLGGRMTFARTDGSDYDVRVVLASPDTSASLCQPLITYGKLSCGVGNTAVLTMYRWVNTMEEYAGDHTEYRHYVVNHEVGHTLGHGHEYCAGKGKVAPVMMQQTKGLKGCLPNGWPYP